MVSAFDYEMRKDSYTKRLLLEEGIEDFTTFIMNYPRCCDVVNSPDFRDESDVGGGNTFEVIIEYAVTDQRILYFVDKCSNVHLRTAW